MITNIEKLRNPTIEEYNEIKKYFNGEIALDDILVYKVRLCNNLVDRDLDCFTHNALENIAEKMVGVIGIKDHFDTVENTHSRLFKCYVVKDENRTNEFDELLEFVVGEAYTIVNGSNNEFIDGLSAGLIKEVSIGFREGITYCSICGKDLSSCGHKVGDVYEGERCIRRIDSVNDVYEWSFVPIPAQLECGVVKRFQHKKEVKGKMKGIKALILKGAANLPSKEASQVIESLEDGTITESEEVKVLRKKVKELEEKLKAYEVDGGEGEGKVKTPEEIISDIIDELKPVNAKMGDIARSLIADIVKADDDGNIVGAEEARELLKGEEYKPLFRSEQTEEVEASDEIEDEEDDITEDVTTTEDIVDGDDSNKGCGDKIYKSASKRKYETIEEKIETKKAEPKFTKVKSTGQTGIFKAAIKNKYEEVN